MKYDNLYTPSALPNQCCYTWYREGETIILSYIEVHVAEKAIVRREFYQALYSAIAHLTRN